MAKSEPSFKDLLKQLVKANEKLARIEKTSQSALNKLKQPLKIDDKRDAKVDQLSAKVFETPKITVENKIDVPQICVDNKIEVPKIEVPKIEVPEIKVPELKVLDLKALQIKVPEIKVPKITVDVLVDLSKKKDAKEDKKEDKKKSKKPDKNDPLVQTAAGINYIAAYAEDISKQLSDIYLQLQSVRTLLETSAAAIVPNFSKLAKGIEKIGKPNKVAEKAQPPPTIRESLVGAARAVTANALGRVMPSILGTPEQVPATKGKPKAKAEKVAKVAKTKAAKEEPSVGPLDKIVNAAKGIGAKAAKGIEKLLGGLADSVAMFGEKKTVQGAKSMLMLAGSLLAIAGALVLFSKVKLADFLKAIVAMTGLVVFAKYVAGMQKNILDGAKGMLMLSGALLIAATGLILFSKVDWPSIVTAGLAMLALVGLAKLVGGMGSDVKEGTTTILMLSASLLAAALGLILFSYVDWSSIFKAGLVLVGLVELAVDIAAIAPEALIGAATIGILSASLLVAALGLVLFAAVDWESIGKAAVALVGLSLLAAGVGLLAGPIILGALAITALGASLLIAAAGIAVFGLLDWSKVGEGIAGLLALSLAMIPIALLLPVFVLAAAGLSALGFALIEFGAGAIVAGVGIKLLGSGFDKFADGLQKVAKIKASDLLATAGAIGALGLAMAGFAVGGVVAGIANLVTNLLSIGQDSPVDQLVKIGEAGEGIQKAADGMNALADAMSRFAEISPDSLKALNEFPWLKAAAFAAAGGVVSIRNVQVSDVKTADQQSNARLVSPQDNVATSNLTGAEMVQYQKQTNDLTAQSASAPIIMAAPAGGSNSANVNNTSVSNVTYNSNNMPDRTTNYLTPAYGF